MKPPDPQRQVDDFFAAISPSERHRLLLFFLYFEKHPEREPLFQTRIRGDDSSVDPNEKKLSKGAGK